MAHDPGRHSTRLSVLFVAAILIPGSVLAYFSIQNVGSRQELAEKKLLEEEERLAADLGAFLREELTRSATAFFAAAGRAWPDLRQVALPPEPSAYVAQDLALDNAGRLLWPRYIGAGPAGASLPEDARFFSLLSGAEQAEFGRKDNGEAARLYQEAALAARRDAGRATGVNGLARVLAKNGLAAEAAAQYQVLIERYGGLCDENGVSFARYALHQLDRIGSSDPASVLQPMSALLSRLASGDIPLTDQTGPLLSDIEEWMKRNPEAAAENDSIRGQIGLLQGRLAFATQDMKEIDFFQSKNPGSVPLPALGSFRIVAGRIAGNPRLFVIQRDAGRPEILGFRVDLEHLRNMLLEHAAGIPTEYRMEVAIVSGGDAQPAGDSLTAVRDLSPLTPWWRVSVRPQDPEIIARYASRRRWIYGTALTFLVAGMVLGVALVLRDLSRERRLSALRTEFVANVTHELKTPLTSIRMFAETLRMKRTRSEEEEKECLDVIVGETQRLSRLINTVLDFSKIERGQKQYQMTEVDMSEVARSTLSTLKAPLQEQGFALEADIERAVKIVGDADALEQAMLNLVDNAVKYSRRSKSVRVGLWTENNQVRFRVADRGIGIPESEKSRIFDKFYRVRTGRESDTGGAGLGLTVVRHIVEAHGGAIELESKVGEGSSFTVTLPRLLESATEDARVE